MSALTRRLSVASGLAIVFSVASSLPTAAAPACPNMPPKVDYQLSFTPYAGDFGAYVAREKGFFSDVGIDVNIIGGTGAASTATNVDQGTVMIGDADMTVVILARSKGQKIKTVALLTDKTSQAFGTLDASIKTPKDFEGRTVGLGAGTGDALLLPVLVKINGGDYSKVKLVNVSPAAYATSLLNGQVDITAAYLDGSFVSDTRLAKEQNKTVYAIGSAANGLDIYQHVVVASEKMIAENSCLLRAFVQAEMKGLHYGVEHPDEAAAIMAHAVPTINPADLPAQLGFLRTSVDTPAFKRDGYGVVETTKLDRDIKNVVEAYGISGGINPQDVYTNEFVK